MSCQSAHTLTPVFDISRHLSTAHTLCPSGTLFLFYLRYKSEVAEKCLDKDSGEKKKSKAKLMLVKWKQRRRFFGGGGGVCSARAGIDLFRYEGPKEEEEKKALSCDCITRTRQYCSITEAVSHRS